MDLDFTIKGISLIQALKSPIWILLLSSAIIIYKVQQSSKNSEQQTSTNTTKSLLYEEKSGIDCWVGINNALEENEASIFYSNKYLKNNDTFYLTNEKCSKFCPTFKFKVDRIDRTDPSVSRAEIFISEKTARLMQIPEDKIREGVFPMIMHVKAINFSNQNGQ